MATPTWQGATREEFILRLRQFPKKQLASLMREQGHELPTTSGTIEDLVGACFDKLVGGDAPRKKSSRTAAGAGSPSDQAPAAVMRYEVRTRGVYERHRCGAKFTNKPQQFSAQHFTAAELRTLQADPYLQVTDLFRRVR